MFRPRIHSQAGTQSPFEHAFCVASIGFVLLLGSDRNPTTRTVPCVHFFFFFLMRRDMLAFSTYYYYYGREASFFGGRRYFEKKRSQDQK
jgi:hypothetical protein